MSDHDALLAAILADPAEDTPRLAYADWLEENAGRVVCPVCHGRPKSRRKASGVASKSFTAWKKSYQRCQNCKATGRISDGRRDWAEFIRVQVELARMKGMDPDCPRASDPEALKATLAIIGKRADESEPCHQCWPKAAELRRRERELLSDENKAAWFGSTYFNRISASYSRGFVSAITCSWSDWSQHADAILARQPVERVKLTTRPAYVEMARLSEATGRDWRPGDEVEWWTRVFKGVWPRIEFELPPERDRWGSYTRPYGDLAAAENR